MTKADKKGKRLQEAVSIHTFLTEVTGDELTGLNPFILSFILHSSLNEKMYSTCVSVCGGVGAAAVVEGAAGRPGVP